MEIPLAGAAALRVHDGREELMTTYETVAIILALIALTILFEKMKHAAEHHAGRALRPIVKRLFGELTVLGFLSMVMYFMEKAGIFLALSRAVTAEKEGGEVLELAKKIHFAMFFVTVVFIVSVLSEVHNGLQSQAEWCQWDRACHDDAYIQNLYLEDIIADEEFIAVSSMPGFRGIAKRTWRFLLPYLRFLPFLRDESREVLEDKLEFCSLRLEFFKERSAYPPFAPAGDKGGNTKTIGDHFNFGSYLTFAYVKKMAAVVDIDVTTWLFFTVGAVCYFLLFGALGFSLQALAWAWVLIGWVFHVLTVNFEMYLLGIRDQFMAAHFIPKPKLQQLTRNATSSFNEDSDINGTEKKPLRKLPLKKFKRSHRRFSMIPLIEDSDINGTEEEPLRNFRRSHRMKLSVGLPMWCYIDIDELDEKRSKLSKAIFGPTPQNRLHALFLFGQDEPAYHILCLRIMLVFSCIYSAQLVILFVPMLVRDEGTTTIALIAYCFLAFVPSLAFIFNKKRLISSLIQVGSIGPFVLPQAVAESEREEKTSMAVRVLVIYFKLARMAKHFLSDPSTFQLKHSDIHYTHVLSKEETTELGRLFALHFDVELQSLLNRVGIITTDIEAHALVEAIFKSVDSEFVELKKAADGKIALPDEVFFQWYTNHLCDVDDTKECAHFLFSLFDSDDSGDITVLEFKQQVEKMAIGISHEEAHQLLQTLDKDGNGVLSEDEFEKLFENFYPLEFKHCSKS